VKTDLLVNTPPWLDPETSGGYFHMLCNEILAVKYVSLIASIRKTIEYDPERYPTARQQFWISLTWREICRPD
jgi:hypothetical protein